MSQAGNMGGGVLPTNVATSYVCDAGTATPSAYVLNVKGAGTTTTSGAGNTITVTSTGGSGFLTASVNLIYTDIQSLGTIPIEIVPSPGPGFALMFIGVSSVLFYQGTDVFHGAGAVNLSYGTTGATAEIAGNAVLTGAASGYTINSNGFSKTSTSGYLLFDNTGYYITGGTFTGGDGNQMNIQVQYYIITTPSGPV
jgi:hypothetical protein